MSLHGRTSFSPQGTVSTSVAQGNPKSGSPRSREERALLLLLGVGAALLLASLFVGWYQVREVDRFGCTGLSESLSPFWVSVSTSGSDCPSSEAGSYQSAGLPQTGVLYAVAGILTAIAAVLALSVIGLTRAGRRSRRASIPLLALAICALAVGAVAPALIAIEQTSTVCHDEGVFQTPFVVPLESSSVGAATDYLNQSPPPMSLPECNGWSFWTGGSPGSSWPVWLGSSGPQDSFGGSNVSGSAVLVWGPGAGWVLDLGGIALLVTGPVLARKPRPAA
jgi:hypothetical protein